MSREITHRDIGKRLLLIRNRAGLTQKEFAESVGIKQGWMSELERGIKKPSNVLLVALEYRYKLNREWLLTGKGEMSAEVEEKVGPVRDGSGVYAHEDERISGLLNMALFVLKADHPQVTSALEQCIIAFHGAIHHGPREKSGRIIRKKN